MADWTVGEIEITRIVELEVPGGTKFLLPDATPEAVQAIDWLRPHYADDAGRLIMSVHSFLLDTPAGKLIVDTGLGNDKERAVPAWSHRQGPFLEDLAAAGFPSDSIDAVLCTHLHVDHVGWNTKLEDGRWVPTFENARYLFGRVEWEHWREADEARFGSVIEDSVRPIVDAGRAEFFEMDQQIFDFLQAVPVPGHSIGQTAFRLSSGGEEALITGDFVHHPCQMRHLDWCSTADHDPAQSTETRRTMLESLAGQPTLILGMHFGVAGHVEKDGDAYRLVPES